jgi:hypothetical protein
MSEQKSYKGYVIGGVAALFLLIMVMWYFGVVNDEIALRNRFEAQESKIETSHDDMWKVIKQKYQVKGDFEDTFKEGLKAVASGRQGGSLFKSSSEANTQLGLPTDIYKDMMATIEGKRGQFMRSQNTLVDIWRQHKTHCERAPNSMILGRSYVMDKPDMITSSKTKKAVEEGVDDDVELK